MVLDQRGNPYVVWAEESGGPRRVFVARWSGKGWAGL